MFATSDFDVVGDNKSFKAFGKGSTNSTIEPQQTQKVASGNSNLSLLDTSMDGFFDFEPHTNIDSPYQDQFSTPGASGLSWSGEVNFLPISPPDSASYSPKESWSLGIRRPSNIVTNIDPANVRAQYGQITPPNDDDDNASLLDYHHGFQQARLPSPEPDSIPRKRKRNGSNTNNEHSSLPYKRNRKYASRNADTADAVSKPEDVKRSKFLERNRVAASKCRQKKKEWTRNLETRAREFQKNNNMLRLEVESLRQEVLFLKTEMLKHSNCECSQIQDFMKSGGSSEPFLETQDDKELLKREHSPIESMPGSAESRRHSSLRDFDEEGSPAAEISNASIVDDENALQALLSSSINHDTSDGGILEQVSG